MSETDYSERWHRVKVVIDVFMEEPTFAPHFEEWESEFNPARDKTKMRVHRIERAWDWRHRVVMALREQRELYEWEIVWRRRYLTEAEALWFWTYYLKGRPWRYEVGEAIGKIDRQFNRRFVYWE